MKLTVAGERLRYLGPCTSDYQQLCRGSFRIEWTRRIEAACPMSVDAYLLQADVGDRTLTAHSEEPLLSLVQGASAMPPTPKLPYSLEGPVKVELRRSKKVISARWMRKQCWRGLRDWLATAGAIPRKLICGSARKSR